MYPDIRQDYSGKCQWTNVDNFPRFASKPPVGLETLNRPTYMYFSSAMCAEAQRDALMKFEVSGGGHCVPRRYFRVGSPIRRNAISSSSKLLISINENGITSTCQHGGVK